MELAAVGADGWLPGWKRPRPARLALVGYSVLEPLDVQPDCCLDDRVVREVEKAQVDDQHVLHVEAFQFSNQLYMTVGRKVARTAA